MRLLLLALFVIGQPNFAQTGSDVLLNQLGEKPPEAPVQEQKKSGAPRAEVSKPVPVVKVRPKPPSDSFQAQLELKAYRQENLPFDVNQWVQDVVYADFAKAAHQWTAIQTQVPEGFRIEAQATQLYLLWKLGLNQTFFNEWIRALANAEFAKSAPAAALEILVTPGFDAWLIKSPVVVSPKQVTTLEKLADDKPLLLTLKAWAALRQGQGRKETALLKKLAPASPLAPLLSEREVYASVKVGDLKGAAWALKNFMEPAVQASKDPELLVKQNVTIARILYQAGQIQAAQGFYERIPNQSNSYLAAREELAWVYLREGDMPKLRGQIKTLASPIFKDRFQPETYLLRAVSDLKMCFYDEVDKDLKDFSRSNTQWAKRIDEALARDVVPQPANPDDYAKLSGRTVALLTSETMKLQALGDQSIGAGPACGRLAKALEGLPQSGAGRPRGSKEASG